MDNVRFERQFRTQSSDGFRIYNGEEKVGRLDLHYTATIVCGTLVVDQGLAEDDILDLTEQIDDELVMSANVQRDDFVVSVFRGPGSGHLQRRVFWRRRRRWGRGSSLGSFWHNLHSSPVPTGQCGQSPAVTNKVGRQYREMRDCLIARVAMLL